MNTSIKSFLSMLLVAGMGGTASVAIYKYTEDKNESAIISAKQPVHFANFSGAPADALATDFTIAAEKAVQSVVHVKTTYPSQSISNPWDPFGMWGMPRYQSQPQMSSGSGVIISADGYIVTNNHVIDNADKVEVTLDDKRTYTAKVIGTDPGTDLALVKIDEKDLPYIPYSNSDNLKVGQWVLAVGNPFNLTSTVTAGIVSAKGRNIHILEGQQYPIESFIQTDAAVNPGNSGGALVSTNGDLVGINSAIASNTGSYTGYSFAIPVNIVRKVVDDLLEYGKVQRGFIGVSIRDIDSKFADDKGIKKIKGVYVNGLTEGGAASSAGIKEGDIITKVGEADVNSSSELQEQVGRFRPGDKINVTVVRNNEEKIIPVVLRNNQGATKITKEENVDLLGARFSDITDEERKTLGITNGVKIESLSAGKMLSAGIKEGFIITTIDNKKVSRPSDVANILNNKQGGVLIEGVYPNGMRAYYGFGL